VSRREKEKLRSKRKMENSALRSNITAITIASNSAKKAEISTNTSKAYSNRRSRKNKCNSNQEPPTRTKRKRRRN